VARVTDGSCSSRGPASACTGMRRYRQGRCYRAGFPSHAWGQPVSGETPPSPPPAREATSLRAPAVFPRLAWRQAASRTPPRLHSRRAGFYPRSEDLSAHGLLGERPDGSRNGRETPRVKGSLQGGPGRGEGGASPGPGGAGDTPEPGFYLCPRQVKVPPRSRELH